MATKLIQLIDGTLVEVEVSINDAQEISSKLADKVQSTWDSIHPVLVGIARPMANALEEIGKEMIVDGAEVELGLSLEGEGNLYITKTKAGANLTVKITLKPKTNE